MKGKKIKRIICALIVAAVSCLSGALFVACDKNNEENGGLAECYYAYYGERFILPQTDGEYYVADAEGNEVELVLGGFTVSSAGDYKMSVKNGSRKEASVINVLKRNAVNFVSERKLTFASLGAETALPAYKAIVGGEETQAETVLVSPSEKEIGKNLSSFVPEETGNYVLRATANGESDESIIEVGESASYKNLLAPMDRVRVDVRAAVRRVDEPQHGRSLYVWDAGSFDETRHQHGGEYERRFSDDEFCRPRYFEKQRILFLCLQCGHDERHARHKLDDFLHLETKSLDARFLRRL